VAEEDEGKRGPELLPHHHCRQRLGKATARQGKPRSWRRHTRPHPHLPISFPNLTLQPHTSPSHVNLTRQPHTSPSHITTSCHHLTSPSHFKSHITEPILFALNLTVPDSLKWKALSQQADQRGSKSHLSSSPSSTEALLTFKLQPLRLQLDDAIQIQKTRPVMLSHDMVASLDPPGHTFRGSTSPQFRDWQEPANPYLQFASSLEGKSSAVHIQSKDGRPHLTLS
jgi:hypothetical protein